MSHDLLAGFPVTIDIPVAWGEMDAFGHVNNVVYFRYFETARIAYMRALGEEFTQNSGVGPILASIGCRFKFPLTFPDTVRVGVRVTEMGADRFTALHRVVSLRHQRIAAEGEGVVVSYDYATGKKAPLPDALRRAIEALEARAATAAATGERVV
jgi:acyl-CoA thioester hydrolase